MTPLFSILHTSARPHAWRAVYDDWMAKAVDPSRVEYVLCIDERWGFSMNPDDYATPLNNIHVVVNTMRRCYVDGVSIAAKASTGGILIVNADDQFPALGWDSLVLYESQRGRAENTEAMFEHPEQWVLEVSTGTPDEHDRGVMVMPILSRARYEQQGFVFYPAYESMFADNDFCETARKDGVVIDARHLMFPHRHQMFDGKGGWKRENWKETLDAAYLAQNRGEAYQTGLQVIERRRLSGFPPMQHAAQRRTIALCLSGERFEGAWVDALLTLYAHLIDLDFAILKVRALGDNTNVYEMREGTRRAVMSQSPLPDLILTLDDDNILSPEHFNQLLSDLDQHSEVDGIAAWCWIHRKDKTGFMASCGEWAPDHLHWMPFHPSLRNETELRPFQVGGMPCMLMRPSAFAKAGEGCFLPVVDNRLEHGLTGEDISFFLAAENGGAKFLVDPKVRIPHLKYVTVEPAFPEEGLSPVKVACMIRAKNEGRWIYRTIKSVQALCGTDVFVMEDGSTDNTVSEIKRAGAVVLPSPFVGMGLDERRDKNWLLSEVKARCLPDWIIMPDGDEELEPGGCEKIRKVLETNPPVDCFAVGFLFLWDRLNQVRLDGVYGKMQRQSIFRANSELKFESYYQGEGENHNHVGLHTSNAPGLGGMRIAALNVFLLHYGYLHREDRIRKYEWITALDPMNEKEGFYKHTVQGDLSEVPASASLKHGGPLKLVTLPGRLVPEFDEVPGPLVPVEAFAD